MERAEFASPHQPQCANPDLFPERFTDDPVSEPEPAYPTCFGHVNFTELYRRTQRIAGSVMRDQLGMTNPEDVDDSLQAGYFKLWQKLEQNPDWLADKPKRYIVQAVVMHSKAQRYSHLRHYWKLIYDAEPEFKQDASLLTASQIDTWIDLAQALETVATQVEDNQPLLLAFYSLVTQTKPSDIGRTFGYSPSGMSKRKKVVQGMLRQALPGYGTTPSSNSVPLPAETPKEQRNQRFITDILLDQKPKRCQPPQKHLYVHIPPNGDSPEYVPKLPLEPEYPTRWGGSMTLAAILNDPQVRRVAHAKASQVGLEDEADREDCLQQGAIRLWQALETNPDLLQDKGPAWVGIYIVYSGNPKQIYRHNTRRRLFTDPDFDWSEADEYIHLGMRSQNGHDTWKRDIEEEFDIARFLGMVTQTYANDTRKLLALYALVTSVKQKDVAPVMGIHEKNYAAVIGNQVKREVQAWGHDFFTTE